MGKIKDDFAVVVERMRRVRPRSRGELSAYIEAFFGLRVPDKRMCKAHDSPLDYLAWSFFGSCGEQHDGLDGVGDNDNSNGMRDCVVWANRGGGKTQLGAIASLLECVFLDGCQVRILGGCEDQSQRMYEYLRAGLDRGYMQYVDGNVTSKGCRFVNGARVGVLAQSDKSVRGHHVQRLRCDEVELFDRDVWQAVQFVTQSRGSIEGRVEVLSTMHRPYGLMHEILCGRHMRVFKWCLLEVIERCQGRQCSQCCLWEDCRGRAKEANGYYLIDDAISQKRRSSVQSWRSEMLCLEPSRDDVVFSEFDVKRNVAEVEYNSDLPLYRAMDFGFTNPLACLFIQVDAAGRVLVLDEHIKSRTTLSEHARLIKQRYPQAVAATYCDPAGKQRHEITGTAVTQELAALGIPTRCRASRVLDGVEMIRCYLSPAAGDVKLVVSHRCEQLIRAFESLHYERLGNGRLSEVPSKDGVNDHVIDALRYFFVNHFPVRYPVCERRY